MKNDLKFGFVACAAGVPGTTDARLYRDLVDDCEHNLGLGYESVWLIEHHFSDYFPTPSPLLMLSHLAARFPLAELGTCVLVLPWQDPLRTAEEVAMLSLLTKQKLHLGIGRGTAKYEYDAFGLDMDASRSLFREHYEVIDSALRGQPFQYQGNHVTMPKRVRLRPEARAENVQFYGAIGSPESAGMMANLGLPPICTSVGNLDAQVATLRSWKEVASTRGVDPDNAFPIMINCIIADTDEQAIAEAQQQIPAFMRAQIDHYTPHETNWEDIPSYAGWRGMFAGMKRMTDPANIPAWTEWQLIGSPETVRQKAQKFIDAGFNHFLLHTATPGVPVADRRRWLRRFATEVIPELSVTN
ncbi:LLM class flavin-dependent oxidoreductase [Mycobacterium sp. SMC-18]|uniref:LLM class flavin-dependent oxidoreductase n=1 Tax=unclassified Mycobacterium TaxID=2642494 RepID=UPI003876D8F6